jgi:hypothetical protein
MATTTTLEGRKMTKDEINQKAKNLPIGQKVYYTGDMANVAAFGVVVAKGENAYYKYYDIEIVSDEPNNEKTTKRVYASSFTAGPGQRYKTIEQYKSEREEQIAAYRKHCGA